MGRGFRADRLTNGTRCTGALAAPVRPVPSATGAAGRSLHDWRPRWTRTQQ